MDLILPLKGEYSIRSRQAPRRRNIALVNDYWRARLYLKEYDRIVLTRGYPKREDTERRMVLPYRGYAVKQITHPHFGADPVFVFAINLKN